MCYSTRFENPTKINNTDNKTNNNYYYAPMFTYNDIESIPTNKQSGIKTVIIDKKKNQYYGKIPINKKNINK